MECERLRRLIERAEARLLRRKEATDWFLAYSANRWLEQPKLRSRVTTHFARKVGALSSSPRRRGYIWYEDCLALEDEALMLCNRLWGQQKRGGEVDINQTKAP